MPWLALTVAVLVLAPLATTAQAPDPASPPPPAPEAPAPPPRTGESAPAPGGESPPPSRPAEPAASPPAGEAKQDDLDFDSDFDDRATPSIALGPVTSGDVLLSVDVGWLRSGLRADLGVARWLDLVLRVDTLLLYERFRGPTSVNLGARVSPVSSGVFRASIDLSVGQVFIPGDVVVENMTAVRGDAIAGAVLPWATLYARVGLRGLSGGSADAGWTRDSEFGLGAERTFGRLIVGAEGFVWSRPSLTGLGQWRIRVGYAL